MKKFFTKAMAVAMMMTAGLVSVSCGSEDIEKILNILVTVSQVNDGTTTTFKGVAALQKSYSNDGGTTWIYNTSTGRGQNSNYKMTIKVAGQSAIQWIASSFSKGSSTSSSVGITMDDITVGGVTLSNISLTQVAYDKTTYKLGDENFEYVYGVSYTYNGTTYSTSSDASGAIQYPYAYVKGQVATSDAGTVLLKNVEVWIVMGDDVRVELTYNGTADSVQN